MKLKTKQRTEGAFRIIDSDNEEDMDDWQSPPSTPLRRKLGVVNEEQKSPSKRQKTS
jgi:hypothetical protein